MFLVTGATGHIGNVLVRELLDENYKVRGLVLPGEDRNALSGLGVEIVEGDILDSSSLEKAFSDVEGVFHLAGLISIMPGKSELIRKVNVDGTKNVIEAAKKAGVHRMLYTSSIHAIKRAPHGVTIDETIPFDVHNTCGEYDRSKAEATLAVLDAAQAGFDAVVVCPTGVLGPFDYRLSEMGNLIRDWMNSGVNFLIDGVYDFVDVRDVARGMISAYHEGTSGGTYILSGERISLVRLWAYVQEITHRNGVCVNLPCSLAKFFTRFTPAFYNLTRQKPRLTAYSIETVMSNSVISSAKAHRELGYSPRSLSESIRDTVNWWAENDLHGLQKTGAA
jgi:dihydroflavonol-4-reductase